MTSINKTGSIPVANAADIRRTPTGITPEGLTQLMQTRYEHLRSEQESNPPTYVLNHGAFEMLRNEPETRGNFPALVMAMLHDNGPNVVIPREVAERASFYLGHESNMNPAAYAAFKALLERASPEWRNEMNQYFRRGSHIDENHPTTVDKSR